MLHEPHICLHAKHESPWPMEIILENESLNMRFVPLTTGLKLMRVFHLKMKEQTAYKFPWSEFEDVWKQIPLHLLAYLK